MGRTSDILLESGTNEVEVLEFLVAGQSYGINVSKVLSIETFEECFLSDLPTKDKEVMGVYQYRGETIPIMDLALILHKTEAERGVRPLVICLEFNRFKCCILVDGVNRIHRVSWEKFESLAGMVVHEDNATLGVVTIKENDVLILDIEGIASSLFDNVSMESVDITDVINENEVEQRKDVHIVLAEDSTTISTLIVKILKQAGYTNVRLFDNGLDAWKFVSPLDFNAEKRVVDIVISDIEMPQMDGLSFCKKFREIPNAKDVPVIMFSSLINDQMAQKCESVGANSWITKPQIHTLIEVLDNYCGIKK